MPLHAHHVGMSMSYEDDYIGIFSQEAADLSSGKQSSKPLLESRNSERRSKGGDLASAKRVKPTHSAKTEFDEGGIEGPFNSETIDLSSGTQRSKSLQNNQKSKRRSKGGDLTKRGELTRSEKSNLTKKDLKGPLIQIFLKGISKSVSRQLKEEPP